MLVDWIVELSPAMGVSGAATLFESWLTGTLDLCAATAHQVALAFERTPELMTSIAFAIAVPFIAVFVWALPKRRHVTQGSTPQSARAVIAGHEQNGATTVGHSVGRLFRKGSNGQGFEVGLRAISFGRAHDCDFRLDGPAISELHAIAIGDHKGDVTVLRASPNKDAVAIYVDGKPIRQCVLHGGEQIKIGSHLFVFEKFCHGLDPLPVHSFAVTAHNAEYDTANGERVWAGNGWINPKAKPDAAGTRS